MDWWMTGTRWPGTSCRQEWMQPPRPPKKTNGWNLMFFFPSQSFWMFYCWEPNDFQVPAVTLKRNKSVAWGDPPPNQGPLVASPFNRCIFVQTPSRPRSTSLSVIHKIGFAMPRQFRYCRWLNDTWNQQFLESVCSTKFLKKHNKIWLYISKWDPQNSLKKYI